MVDYANGAARCADPNPPYELTAPRTRSISAATA